MLSPKDESIINAVATTDEPIYILRAQDHFAVPLVESHLAMARQYHLPDATIQPIINRLNEFYDWRERNDEKLKFPD